MWKNLAPHFSPDFIKPQHFRHSAKRKPVWLSKSGLERAMEEVIWGFLRLSVEDGRIITARLDARFRMNMLRGLGEKHMSKEDFSALSDLLKRIGDLYAERNLIAHGIWITSMPDNIPAVMSLREKLPDDAARNEIITTQMSPDRMAGIIRNMILVTHVLIDLRRTLSA